MLKHNFFLHSEKNREKKRKEKRNQIKQINDIMIDREEGAGR